MAVREVATIQRLGIGRFLCIHKQLHASGFGFSREDVMHGNGIM